MSATRQLHYCIWLLSTFMSSLEQSALSQNIYNKTGFIVYVYYFDPKTNQYSLFLTDGSLINIIPHAYDEQIASYVQAWLLHLFITIPTNSLLVTSDSSPTARCSVCFIMFCSRSTTSSHSQTTHGNYWIDASFIVRNYTIFSKQGMKDVTW